MKDRMKSERSKIQKITDKEIHRSSGMGSRMHAKIGSSAQEEEFTRKAGVMAASEGREASQCGSCSSFIWM